MVLSKNENTNKSITITSLFLCSELIPWSRRFSSGANDMLITMGASKQTVNCALHAGTVNNYSGTGTL